MALSQFHKKRSNNKNGKQYVYAYYPNIDATMHEFGVCSTESKTVFESVSASIEKLLKETKDTLFVISADHGQIEVAEYLDFCEDEELYGFLKIYFDFNGI